MSAVPASRLVENPFYVLGLPSSASRIEVEREGQKLLAMLELGLAQADFYQTPLGPQARTPELVRAALAELRDPARRLLHELWARLEPKSAPEAAQAAGAAPGGGGAAQEAAESERMAPFAAQAVLGWRRR